MVSSKKSKIYLIYKKFYQNIINLKNINILIIVDALLVGGAEIFALRFSEALRVKGYSVKLVVLRGDLVSWPHYYSIAKDLELILFRIPGLRWVLRIDGLLYKLGAKFSLLRFIQAYKLRNLLSLKKPDIVHSHLLTADIVTSIACCELGIPWITTMHGDYLELESSGCSRAARIPDFKATLVGIEASVGHIVCITDQQKAQLSQRMHKLDESSKISKIYNGYFDIKENLKDRSVPEALKGLPDDAFVIGMVSRGVRDKGWDVLIAAFEALNFPDAWLVLVGDGDHLQQIRSSIRNEQIIFCGNVVDPLRYIIRFDVACLPSQFPTESLPTVIIEYLNLGKPVIATAVGEIPKMLEANSHVPAGLLIELGDTLSMTTQMKIALQRLYENEVERDKLSVNAAQAFKKFDMDGCVGAYLDVYSKVQV